MFKINNKIRNTAIALGITAGSFAQTAIKTSSQILEKSPKADFFEQVTKNPSFNKFLSSDSLIVRDNVDNPYKFVVKVAEYVKGKDTLKTAYLSMPESTTKFVDEIKGINADRIGLFDIKTKESYGMDFVPQIDSLLKTKDVFLPSNEIEKYGQDTTILKKVLGENSLKLEKIKANLSK